MHSSGSGSCLFCSPCTLCVLIILYAQLHPIQNVCLRTGWLLAANCFVSTNTIRIYDVLYKESCTIWWSQPLYDCVHWRVLVTNTIQIYVLYYMVEPASVWLCALEGVGDSRRGWLQSSVSLRLDVASDPKPPPVDRHTPNSYPLHPTSQTLTSRVPLV